MCMSVGGAGIGGEVDRDTAGVVLSPPFNHSRNKKKSSRRPSLDVNMIDFMKWRLLLAAGRTCT
eukprot:15234794-Ditylum_brightwellii.AAC.1